MYISSSNKLSPPIILFMGNPVVNAEGSATQPEAKKQ